MPIFSKNYPNSDVVLGQVIVAAGTAVPKTYDPTTSPNPVTDRAQHWASGDSLGWAQNLDNRFKYVASGSWE